MFNTVSNWFTGNECEMKQAEAGKDEKTAPSSETVDSSPEKCKNAKTNEAQNVKIENTPDIEPDNNSDDKKEQKSSNDTDENTEPLEEDIDFEIDIDKAKEKMKEVSDKAVTTAKEWGSYLFNFGKAAGQTVADTAKQLKNTMEESSLLGDFSKEQEKFLADKKEKERRAEAAVPPWVGYNEEEIMKTQILALSMDKRNFLRNPPSGIQFQFDYTTVHPVAMATMFEDPNLEKMRYELVPKQVKEDIFWRNYFYRVSLIKQSTQLTSLAQQSGSTGERSSGSSRRSSTGSESKDLSSNNEAKKNEEDNNLPVGSPSHDNEFVSDAFDESQLSEEDLQKEIELLRVSDNKDLGLEDGTKEESQWEKELQKELQDYELVNTDGVALDDDDLESEILKQIEDEANGM